MYVDWQRNQFAATTAAAYSPRHRPGVPVSMPVAWDEVGARDLRGAHFNRRNAAARIAEQGNGAVRQCRAWRGRKEVADVIDELAAATTTFDG